MKEEFRQVAAPIRDRAAQDPRALVCAAAISQWARNCFHASMRLPAHCSGTAQKLRFWVPSLRSAAPHLGRYLNHRF
jgi:hypothetical protein